MPVLIGQTSILYDNITLSQHLDTWIGWHKKATWNKFFKCSPNILSGYYTDKVKEIILIYCFIHFAPLGKKDKLKMW